jgi:PAS domain S-box-containing protein/putative nucleotidyltransferase with HDIG domain
VEIRNYPVKIENKTVVLGIVRDISMHKSLKRRLERANHDLKLKADELSKEYDKRVRVEKKLQERSEKYKDLFDNYPDGVAVLDVGGTVTSCNKALENLIGYKKDGIIGKHFTKLKFFSAKDIPRYMKMYSAILNCRKVKPFKMTMINKDGKRLITEAQVGSIKKGNKLSEIQIVIRGITQNVKDRKELEESKERYRILSEATTDGIFIHDKFKVIDTNKNLAKMFGMEVSEGIGKNLFDFVTTETKAKALKNILVKNHKPYKGEAVRKDGSKFPVEIYAKNIPFKGKKARIVSVRDLTPYMKAEEEIERLSKFPSENPNPVGRIGFDGKILYGNKACKIKLKEWNCCIGGQAPDPINNILKEMVKRKSFKPQTLELDIEDKSFEFIITPIKEAGYVNVYAKDITERKKTREELVRSEKQLSAVFNNNPVLLVLLDENRQIVNANIAASNLAGSGIEEIVGVRGGEAFGCLNSLDDPKGCGFGPNCNNCNIRNTVMDTFRTGKYHNKVKAVLPVKVDGKEKVLNLLVNTVPIDIGEKRLILVALDDITELTENESKLKASYRKLQKTLKDTIDTLAIIIETRDPYTYGHQKNVALLAAAIAEEMGLDEDRIEAVNTAGKIHDIGKISVPASILVKPGKITDIEFNLIKTHPQTGYDMIKNIEFPWPLADIILQHHERLDGSGYPNGLKGEDIMLEAKILAVADVVEAISSHRPYRPALGIDKAIEEIVRNRGLLYDPKVVDTCRKVLFEKDFEKKFNI